MEEVGEVGWCWCEMMEGEGLFGCYGGAVESIWEIYWIGFLGELCT